MSSDTLTRVILIAVGLIFLVVIVGLNWWMLSYKCEIRWRNSGMATDWGPWQGCLLHHDGKWVPAESYREGP